jgi:hypothetical protein
MLSSPLGEDTMNFFQVWLTGYYNPSRVVDELRTKPAPQWGVYAQLTRALLDSLLLYLPLALMGREPSTSSYLAFLPTKSYYLASVFFVPVFIVAQWILLSGILHLILRLSGQPSDIDQILNITGMAALIVGSLLVVWDWVWIVVGWESDVLLGISHLVLVIWAIVITASGFHRILGLPVWLAVLLNLLWLVLGEPLGAIFMRAPV